MTLRNQKGFTLIELAIVLVIIGIILGAVLKGQDLIANARAKKVINWEKSWETAQWTYLDRKGRFAGDANKNGLIGDDTASEQTSSTSGVGEIGSAGFINAPTTTITVGSLSFYMRMGYTGSKNIIVICKNAACGSAFDSDEAIYMEAIDTTIDGVSDPNAGNVRGAKTVTLVAGASEVVSAITEDTALTSWNSFNGLAYFFDRPR